MLSFARLLRYGHRLFRRWCSSPTPTSTSTSVPLRASIKSLLNERDLDKLVADFTSLSANPRFRANQAIYAITVRRLASSGRLASVESILEAQKLYSSDVTREGFAVRLISLYSRAGMLSHAAATFNQLPSLGCPRTVASFNALLTAYAHAGDTDRLTQAFHEISQSDLSIVPNIISYNILLLALCEKGDPDAALDAVKQMEEVGIEPDSVTFNTLLNGFYGKNRFRDAEKVWEKMKEKNMDQDIRSYNARLRGLVAEGRTMEAVELVGKLKDLGLKPDTFSFNAVIKGYIQDGKLEEAKMVYLKLVKNDCAPNRRTFELLIPKLCEVGELNMALKLCFESLSRKCSVEVGLLQQVVDLLVQKSRVEDAKRLVKKGRFKSYVRRNLKLPLSVW